MPQNIGTNSYIENKTGVLNLVRAGSAKNKVSISSKEIQRIEYHNAIKQRVAQSGITKREAWENAARLKATSASDSTDNGALQKAWDRYSQADRDYWAMDKRLTIEKDVKNKLSNNTVELQKKSMGIALEPKNSTDTLLFGDNRTAQGSARFEDLKKQLGELGISEIGRFRDLTNVEVEQLIKDRNPENVDDRPLALMVYPTEDHNQAFEANEILNLMMHGYRVVYVQAKSENDFFDSIERYGAKQKIDLLVVGGHGDPEKTNFSAKADGRLSAPIRYAAATAAFVFWSVVKFSVSPLMQLAALGFLVFNSDRIYQIRTDDYFLDINDGEKIKKRDLEQYMIKPHGRVLMCSCSTGKPQAMKTYEESENMANMLTDALGVPVYAPTDDSYMKNLRFDERGIVSEVEYAVFNDGKIQPVGTYIAHPTR